MIHYTIVVIDFTNQIKLSAQVSRRKFKKKVYFIVMEKIIVACVTITVIVSAGVWLYRYWKKIWRQNQLS